MNMVTFFRVAKALNLTPNDLTPKVMLPEGMSIMEDFLDLTLEQQATVRALIRMLKEGNKADN